MGWGDAQGGRPRKLYVRRRVDYPPPNPQPTPCRIWQGSVDRYGYGRVHMHLDDKTRRQLTASRWVWLMANGPIPDGMVVRHKCDNPPCFRLSHLELGTVADNNRDAQARGHLGKPPSLSPSQLETVRLGRAAGMTYRQIYEDWPEIRKLVTLRGLAWIGKELERGWQPDHYLPEGYSPRKGSATATRRDPGKDAAAAKYAAWRESRRNDDGRSEPVRPEPVRPGTQTASEGDEK
jgi:hypothetical protein